MTHTVRLDITNMVTRDHAADGIVHLHEALCDLVAGLDVVFDIGDMMNEFGHLTVPFVGTRTALEVLIDRCEEDTDLRPELYESIEVVPYLT